jgi:TPR repeat protein
MKDEIRSQAEIALQNGNFVGAVSLLRPVAEAGDAEAQYRLGNIYFQGGDEEVSSAMACHWLNCAAEQGHPEACYRLAMGLDLSRNEEEQKALLIKAAELGSADAQRALGTHYAVGDWPWPCRVDLTESAKWYGKAAEAGNRNAQYEIGFILILGEGVQKDPIRGLAWLEEAASKGHKEAIRVLIDIYEGAFDVPKNPERASFWRAAEAQQRNEE